MTRFDRASFYVAQTRDLLANELAALVGESYSRAYNVVVTAQQLAEMEEVITYKMVRCLHIHMYIF
jgi:FKBP12-rapamycin complex-associated protein